MPTPTVTRAPRSQPDHFDEHTRLAQVTDIDGPRGIIGYQLGSTAGAAIGAPTTVFTLNNVAAKARRLYLISWAFRAHATGASAGYMRSLLYWSGTMSVAFHDYLPANATWQFHVGAYILPIVVDVTVNIELRIDTGTSGTYWTDRGGHLKIEDIGPDRGRQ